MREITIIVLGLGCSEINLNSQTYFFRRKLRTDVIVMCNKSIYRTLRNIGGTVCRLPISKTNSFVIQVFRKVADYLNNGYHVNLVGFSYGGAVVSRVAQMIPNKEGMKIITAGSIYAPNIPRVIHLMFENDVALRCNGLNPNKDKYIIWLKHSNYKNYKPKRYKLLGSGKEWKIHNSYFNYICDILVKKPQPKTNIISRSRVFRRFNAPRMKTMNIKNVPIENYYNTKRKIIKLTNVPGGYNLRKKLLSNLEKELVVYDFINANTFKPYNTNNYYYLKYGTDPKHWLFLLPESYNMLKQNGPTFKHFVLRNSAPNLRVANFRRVIKKNKRTNNK